jgi:recombinational DNA repair ATPase RecF
MMAQKSPPPSLEQTQRSLLSIVRSVKARHVDTELYRGFRRLPTDKLYSVRMNKSRKDRLAPEIPAISAVIAENEIGHVRSQGDAKQLKRAVYAVASLMESTFRAASSRDRRQYQALVGELVSGLEPHPQWLLRLIPRAQPQISDRAINDYTGRAPSEWRSNLEAIRLAYRFAATPPLDRVSAPVRRENTRTTAARLAEAAKSMPPAVQPTLEYPTTDVSVKILSARVTGFRGSPATTEVDFTRKGKPVSVLLWGDNGTGKSTLIDGIEFALQARVDRSADFNSSLRAAIQNISVAECSTSVMLSDRSSIDRSLAMGSDGRFIESKEPIRPGFRIAPVVIRRADILRFLDTETLARGTVFFDYFPEPRGRIGFRPDEELRVLDEEQFSLRVVRDDVARRLRAISGTERNVSNTAELELFVEDLLPGDDRSLSDEEKWETVDPAIRELIVELRTTQARLKSIRKKLEKGVELLNPIAYQEQLARIKPVLESIAPELTHSFQRIARIPHVEAIHTLVGYSGPVSLDVVVEFTNGVSAFPQQVFSEGYKDLIALLFFLAVTKRAHRSGQAPVLILDDVLQSVDSTVRLDMMAYVLDEFRDWQLIITGHDRAWHAQLKSLFNNKGIQVADRQIVRWNFEEGLIIREAAWNTAASLSDALDRSDMQAAASASGVLLEQICQELSWRLAASVQRRPGDRYTLGDLWPGVKSALRKTSAKPVCDELDQLIVIRNLIGAHYNEWAAAISDADVLRLAAAAQSLYELTFCPTCHTWVARHGSTTSCDKGEISL